MQPWVSLLGVSSCAKFLGSAWRSRPQAEMPRAVPGSAVLAV